VTPTKQSSGWPHAIHMGTCIMKGHALCVYSLVDDDWAGNIAGEPMMMAHDVLTVLSLNQKEYNVLILHGVLRIRTAIFKVQKQTIAENFVIMGDVQHLLDIEVMEENAEH
jgi:hypothetical protein